MDEILNLDEIERTLQDANLYDPNLSREDSIILYKAVKESQATAILETSQRLNESQEISSDEDDPLVTVVQLHDLPQPKSTPVKEVPLTNNNFISKYTAIQWNDEFLRSSLQDKTKMLLTHDKLMNEKMYEKSKKSLVFISLPPPIKLPNVTLRDQSGQRSPSPDLFEETTYISRSGRTTKRKNYADVYLEEMVLKKKSIEDDETWLSKSTPDHTYESKPKRPNVAGASKSTNSLSSGRKNVSEIELEIQNGVAHNESTEPKKKPQRVFQPKNQITCMENFEDDYKPSPKRKRCELMFDKLKENEKKKEECQAAMDRFNKSLDAIQINNASDNSDDESDVFETTPVFPRRIIPLPVVRKKPISRKKNHNEKISTKQSAISEEVIDNENPAKRRNPKMTVKENIEPQPSTSSLQSDSSQDCPICQKPFPMDQIEGHAAVCEGEEVEAEPISCPNCYKVILTPEKYRIHVSLCQKEKKK